jgi:hypothetical protein
VPATRVQVVGGPFDGVGRAIGEDTVATGGRAIGEFAWIDGTGRVWKGAAPGRALYRLWHNVVGSAPAFVYAGDRWERCPGDCGGYTQRVEGGSERQPCRLCAASSSRRHHHHG